jgi:hypothetical protein
LIKIIRIQVNKVSEIYLKILFEKFEAYFDLKEDKIINELSREKLGLYLKKIDIYCEEISQISN